MVNTGIYNFSIDRGSSFSLDISCGKNLSGFSGYGGIKHNYSSGYLVEYTVSIHSDFSGINLSIPWSETTEIPVGRMIHELEIYETGNIKTKYLKGWVDIYPEITL